MKFKIKDKNDKINHYTFLLLQTTMDVDCPHDTKYENGICIDCYLYYVNYNEIATDYITEITYQYLLNYRHILSNKTEMNYQKLRHQIEYLALHLLEIEYIIVIDIYKIIYIMRKYLDGDDFIIPAAEFIGLLSTFDNININI